MNRKKMHSPVNKLKKGKFTTVMITFYLSKYIYIYYKLPSFVFFIFK